MYWTHNLHFIAYARAQQGRYEEAKQAALEMVTNVGDGDLEMQMLEGFRLYPMMVDLRFHRWDTLLATPRARAEPRAQSRVLALRARDGARGRKAKSATQRPSSAASSASAPPCRPMANTSSTTRRAIFLRWPPPPSTRSYAAARGDTGVSLDAWRRAVTLESALQYDEPPAWFYTVRESLGAALLRSGDHAQAEEVFRTALATRPRDGRLLFGLWQTLLAQNRASEALLVQGQFARAWRGATTQLTLDDL